MTERRYRRFIDTNGTEWLLEVSLDERFGTWVRARWRHEGDDWILHGIGSSGGITDPDEALDAEEEYIGWDVAPRMKTAS